MRGAGRRGKHGRHGHHEHHGSEHDERGRRERFFGQGELRLITIHLLSQEPGSGYDVVRKVEARTGGRYTPSAGISYPTLTLLQDLGHVSLEASDGSRNIYRVTASGSAYLTAYATTLERLLAKMHEAQTNAEVAVPDEVQSAVANVEMAICSRLRRSGSGVTDKLVVLLNELVRQINVRRTGTSNARGSQNSRAPGRACETEQGTLLRGTALGG